MKILVVLRRVTRRSLVFVVGPLLGCAIAASIGLASAGGAVHARPSDASGCASGTTVQTHSGPVCGIVNEGDDQWLGIPYAAPPVGTLRWQPPQPPAPWTQTLAATAFGSECVQGPVFPATTPAMVGSEDCLFLNVVRPDGPASGLPVLVHIHGGGFWEGSGNGDYSLLANTGHEIVVSMNYRLGVFGFEANKGFGPHSGDYGLEDQQAALRWVKDNIRAFGGDPSEVTIYGESAGGSSVCDEIASPTAAGLFENGLSESGEYNTLFGAPADPTLGGVGHLEPQDCKSALPSQQQANELGEAYTAALGCTHASDVAGCMRGTSTAAAFTAAGNGYQYGGAGTIGPTLNGTTLVDSPRDTFRKGRENRVTVIAGTDRDEDLNGWPLSVDQFNELVQQQYGHYASEVHRLYPLSNFDSPGVAFRTISADSTTVCQSLITDKLLARHVPVYGYEIDDGSASSPVYSLGIPGGTSHVFDADWGLSPSAASSLTDNESVLARQQLAEVTAVARTGNPNAEGTPTWPEFNGTGEIMSWAPGGDSQVVLPEQMSFVHHCGFWDSITPGGAN